MNKKHIIYWLYLLALAFALSPISHAENKDAESLYIRAENLIKDLPAKQEQFKNLIQALPKEQLERLVNRNAKTAAGHAYNAAKSLLGFGTTKNAASPEGDADKLLKAEQGLREEAKGWAVDPTPKEKESAFRAQDVHRLNALFYKEAVESAKSMDSARKLLDNTSQGNQDPVTAEKNAKRALELTQEADKHAKEAAKIANVLDKHAQSVGIGREANAEKLRTVDELQKSAVEALKVADAHVGIKGTETARIRQEAQQAAEANVSAKLKNLGDSVTQLNKATINGKPEEMAEARRGALLAFTEAKTAMDAVPNKNAAREDQNKANLAIRSRPILQLAENNLKEKNSTLESAVRELNKAVNEKRRVAQINDLRAKVNLAENDAKIALGELRGRLADFKDYAGAKDLERASATGKTVDENLKRVSASRLDSEELVASMKKAETKEDQGNAKAILNQKTEEKLGKAEQLLKDLQASKEIETLGDRSRELSKSSSKYLETRVEAAEKSAKALSIAVDAAREAQHLASDPAHVAKAQEILTGIETLRRGLESDTKLVREEAKRRGKGSALSTRANNAHGDIDSKRHAMKGLLESVAEAQHEATKATKVIQPEKAAVVQTTTHSLKIKARVQERLAAKQTAKSPQEVKPQAPAIKPVVIDERPVREILRERAALRLTAVTKPGTSVAKPVTREGRTRAVAGSPTRTRGQTVAGKNPGSTQKAALPTSRGAH